MNQVKTMLVIQLLKKQKYVCDFSNYLGCGNSY